MEPLKGVYREHMPRAILYVPKNKRLTAFCNYESQKRGEIRYSPTIGRKGGHGRFMGHWVLLALDLISTFSSNLRRFFTCYVSVASHPLAQHYHSYEKTYLPSTYRPKLIQCQLPYTTCYIKVRHTMGLYRPIGIFQCKQFRFF